MKKTYFLALVLTASLLAACTGSETTIEESDGALSVTASIGESTTEGVSTRALFEGTSASFSSGNQIGLFVDNTGSSTSYAPTDVSTCTYTTSFGAPSPAIYINENATVYAYYSGGTVASLTNPTSSSTIAATVSSTDLFNTSASNSPAQVDYLWAAPNAVTKSDRDANLTFYHALSKIIFVVNKAENYAGIGTLTSIVLTDADAASGTCFLAGTGTMAVADGTLGSLTETSPLTFTSTGTTINTYNATTPTIATAWFLAAPTTVPTSITLALTIDGQLYTTTAFPTTPSSWGKGTSYTYTVTVGTGTLTVNSTVTISDWATGTSASGTVN